MSNRQAPDNTLAAQLGRLVQAIEASGRAVLPNSGNALLQAIVEAAARIFNAAAASIALIDEDAQELVFKVSVGAGNESIVGKRIPLDSGIAGYVAMTGQPMAISNVQQDVRFNQSFAQSTGYVPRSILATPLVLDNRVLGVMEVLDKLNASSFGMQDMELLAMFARQAAIAIEQSQQYERINDALVRGLKELVSPANGETDELVAALAAKGDESSRLDLLALAKQFNAIGQLGEPERRACIKVLETFGEYARARANLY